MSSKKIQMGTQEKWIVVVAGIGLLLSTLDTGIINVALPTLATDFHVNAASIAWTVTLYTLSIVGTIIVFGRLSDKFGHLKIYSLGLIVFTVFSVLCGFSQNILEIVGFRILQGIGASMLQATAVAIISTTVSEKHRDSAFGTLSALMGLGPVLGPSVGGAIISLCGWRWIFWINVPISIIGLIGCRYFLMRNKEVHNSNSIDLSGNLLLTGAILALLVSVSTWNSNGGYHLLTVVLLGACAILLFAFTKNEARIEQPIIRLSLLRNKIFSASLLAIFVFGGSTSLGFIIPPYFLEQISHLAPWQVGIVNLSSPLGIALLSKVSGHLMKRFKPIRLMTFGLIVMFISYAVLGQMQNNWSPLLMALLLFLYGMGGGLFLPANISALMEAADKDSHGTIGATQRMVQNLGIIIYTALASNFIHTTSESQSVLMGGLRNSWIFAALTFIVVIVIFVIILTSKKKVRVFN
ncbi:MFS transporter [Pectinatus frisingensis]|uniref:MFS transporter n=1 Tax=Pectinatus frisingensis TaxID=865 RepID=UPI001E2CCD19|nr:MFS transporter [Pectinatus frisingensis]